MLTTEQVAENLGCENSLDSIADFIQMHEGVLITDRSSVDTILSSVHGSWRNRFEKTEAALPEHKENEPDEPVVHEVLARVERGFMILGQAMDLVNKRLDDIGSAMDRIDRLDKGISDVVKMERSESPVLDAIMSKLDAVLADK